MEERRDARMAAQNQRKGTRHTAARRPKKKPRNLESTVAEIAQRPAPIRRSIFDLLDTLIRSREVQETRAGEPNEGEEAPTERGDQAERKDRKGRARGSRGSR
jgi:hypothetical protein